MCTNIFEGDMYKYLWIGIEDVPKPQYFGMKTCQKISYVNNILHWQQCFTKHK